MIRSGVGDFGNPGTQEEIETWLAQAGLDLTGAKRSGPFFFFEAHKRQRASSGGGGIRTHETPEGI